MGSGSDTGLVSGIDAGEGGEMRGWSEMESWPFIGGVRV